MLRPHPGASVPAVIVAVKGRDLQSLFPGDIVGRLKASAVRLDDPRVSEAHAMLALRGHQFWLLGLRGSLGIGDRWQSDAPLSEGLRIALADGVFLEVVSMTLPDEIWVLVDDDDIPVPLDRPEWSVFDNGIEPGTSRDALAWLWSWDGGWQLQLDGQRPHPISAGHQMKIGHRVFRLERQPAAVGETPATSAERWNLPPMEVTVQRECTTIRVDGRPLVELYGNAHAVVRHTAQLTQDGQSVHWSVIASAIWMVNATERNWFTNLGRLRDKLERHRLPVDLVQCRRGQVRLTLRPGIDRLIAQGLGPT